jgi:hypothetical protein
MVSLEISLPELAEKWFSRFFIGSAPYQLSLSVFDIFMYEGSPILFRVGLAILATYAEPLGQCNCKEDFMSCLSVCLSSAADPMDLIKVYQQVRLYEPVSGEERRQSLCFDSNGGGSMI